ncbi:unnamed protein product [Protopolystoma xenopodis]|uniref:LRRNT domain-containing protein n=1 Tax=Protopolystoma xenopodis TaxID=117903 RepID=A0A448XJL4_9PLAT|nr:unnamed protein product [Protopolystoma xenopodis]
MPPTQTRVRTEMQLHVHHGLKSPDPKSRGILQLPSIHEHYPRQCPSREGIVHRKTRRNRDHHQQWQHSNSLKPSCPASLPTLSHSVAFDSSGHSHSCDATERTSAPSRLLTVLPLFSRSPLLLLHVPLLLTMLVWSQSATGQFVEPRLCNSICYCRSAEATVDCDMTDQVQGLPTNLPTGSLKLLVKQGQFTSPGRLTRANLTGLEQVEVLKIINSRLRSIQSKAFIDMVHLRSLDLSSNALTRLEPFTFAGLRLNSLHLQQQNFAQPALQEQTRQQRHSLRPSDGQEVEDDATGRQGGQGLRLHIDTFKGLAAKVVSLGQNGISRFDYDVFQSIQDLDRLVLSFNAIRSVNDARAVAYFQEAGRLLDLTGNPLECSCRLAWLVQRIPDWVRELPTLNLTCQFFEHVSK